MGEQPVDHPTQTLRDATPQHQPDEQQGHADHRTRHRQCTPKDEDFACELAQQQERDELQGHGR